MDDCNTQPNGWVFSIGCVKKDKAASTNVIAKYKMIIIKFVNHLMQLFDQSVERIIDGRKIRITFFLGIFQLLVHPYADEKMV